MTQSQTNHPVTTDDLRMIFPIQSDLIDYLIFKTLHDKEDPTGSWSLKDLLDQTGVTVGTATIGRNLKMMDSQGYTVQISNKGRILTDIGIEKAKHLQGQVEEYMLSRYLFRLSENKDIETLIDVVSTRLTLECEIAALAAQNADAHNLAEIRWSIDQHRLVSERKKSASGSGLDFHLLLAKASQSRTRYSLLSWLIHEHRCLEWSAVSSCSLQFADTYTNVHEKILNAVELHNPEEASQLMKDHLNEILSVLSQFV